MLDSWSRMLPELLRYKRNMDNEQSETNSVQILESPSVELDDDMLTALGL